MNIIGCLDRATKGVYCLDGEEVSERSPDELAEIRNNKIGFVFQSFNLLSRTSALENVELPMIYGNTTREKREELANRALEILGLSRAREPLSLSALRRTAAKGRNRKGYSQ